MKLLNLQEVGKVKKILASDYSAQLSPQSSYLIPLLLLQENSLVKHFFKSSLNPTSGYISKRIESKISKRYLRTYS